MIVNAVTQFLGVLILLTAFEMLAQSYVRPMINTVAIQSILLSAMMLILGIFRNSLDLLILSALTLVVRGIAIPEVMKKDIKKRGIWVYREVETRVPALVIVGLLLAIAGYIFYREIAAIIPVPAKHSGALPFILFLLGFLLIIAKKNALTQMAGYIVEENALLYAGVSFSHMPLILEAGVFLDLLALVLAGVILAAEKDYGVLELEELVG